jgi:hypothetical protein
MAADEGMAIRGAVLAIAVLVLIYLVAKCYRARRREKFASQRAKEVHAKAQEVFAKGGGDARYSDYKQTVPDADPVQYNDVRKLYREGNLTPETVENVM